MVSGKNAEGPNSLPYILLCSRNWELTAYFKTKEPSTKCKASKCSDQRVLKLFQRCDCGTDNVSHDHSLVLSPTPRPICWVGYVTSTEGDKWTYAYMVTLNPNQIFTHTLVTKPARSTFVDKSVKSPSGMSSKIEFSKHCRQMFFHQLLAKNFVPMCICMIMGIPCLTCRINHIADNLLPLWPRKRETK